MSAAGIQCWLLLLLLPTLLLAQDDCSHNCKNAANRYYVRPEGSAETLCPAQPCFTPSQLRDHFSECERDNSCRTANTSLVLLPGTYTSASNHWPIIPQLKFLSLTGYGEDCNTDSSATPSIDCKGTSISLMFQHIECLHVQNCVAFTGHDTTVEVDHVTFHDSMIRLASITAADHSELDYNYTLGSQSYCLLQKQLADIRALTPSNSKLALRNVSFSSDYHSACAREYGIQLATIHATDSALNIADCFFTQIGITHISLLHSTLHTSGQVQIENANTAIIVKSSTVVLAGAVGFFNNYNSAIHALDTHSTVLLAGTVEFTNNNADKGGAVFLESGNLTVTDNAQVAFQGNHADTAGGAIASSQHVTIAGSVQFINNSAAWGGAIDSYGNVTIADNALVVFQSNHAEDNGGAISSVYHVTIAGTAQFVNNSAETGTGGAIFSFLGDVTVPDNAQVAFQGNHAKTDGGAISSFQNVTIAGSVQFINNSASDWGGAIQSDGNVTIADNAQVVFQSNHAEYGGGAILSGEFVAIAGSVQFVNNSAEKGGAIRADVVNVMTIPDNAQVVFQGNHAKTFGGAILSLHHVAIAGSVQFINNNALWGGAIHSSGNMTIADNAQVVFECNHAEKAGGAIVINSNLLQLAGSVQLINNTAVIGGAIALFPGYMTVASNARVVFQGNHAYHVGGAIYSSTRASNLVPMFMDVTQSYCIITFGINCKVKLLNNTAVGGGSAMYGISMSKCDNIYYENYDSQILFDIITINPDSLSAVSSDPLRVCICPDQSTPDCLAILPDQNIPHLNYTVYPGQNFTIPATVVGFNFALTSGSVYAQFLNSDASLGSNSQYVQGVNQTGCSLLQYSVLSNKKQETLALTADRRQVGGIDSSVKEDIRMQNNNSPLNFALLRSIANPNRYYSNHSFMTNLTDGVFHLAGAVQIPLQSSPVYVSVQLLDCPPGFTLTGQQRCDCDDRILTNLLTCNINNQTVHRHGNIWINASFSGYSSNGVIVHEHCPFGYCKQDPVNVDLTNPDTQCAYNRSGTLCGACKPNFSLGLGGSQCLPNCLNKYLSLLIPFALAGFALVFFIKILNLTVSQGTINGLIFYANIVTANRSVFFPAQHNKFLSFLFVFISWLNLDLGIETCFIEGLDGYWKTWLQFVFPFYVWAIAGAIIIASDYSIRATKIFGKNSHSVLATLFLLSYAKLIRSIIAVFCFTTIVLSDDSSLAVWAFDGNIHYFSRKRIPLFLFALAIVLLLGLPYIAVLLSAQWLRTQTHRKGLRWLKPFLDAYYGPFKDKHHYWVGVLLVVRGVLFVLFASFFALESNVNLLLIIITSISLTAFPSISGRLYKKIFLSALENSFFLNLGVLAAGTFYIRLVGGSQEALVTTSVGIAFLQFVGITAFHTYHFVIVPVRNKCKDILKARVESQSRGSEMQPLLEFDSSDSDSEDDVRLIARLAVTHSEVCLEELREDKEQQLLPTMELHGTAEPPPRGNQAKETADQQLPPAEASKERVIDRDNTGEILLPKGHNRPEITRPTVKQHQIPADQPPPPPPQESSEPPRYFAAEREERFIDFNAPRETLLEYTQYRLPQERNEPASDSIYDRERELLNDPPQESSHQPRYFAAEREGLIDFTAPREPLLELLT